MASNQRGLPSATQEVLKLALLTEPKVVINTSSDSIPAFNSFFDLLQHMKKIGIFSDPILVTPKGAAIEIDHQKNIDGALGVYATQIALQPYYENFTVTHVNGVGFDWCGSKGKDKDYGENKNWAQRYKNGPSLTPNKERTEVRSRYPEKAKGQRILITSATYTEETATLLREDRILVYHYSEKITDLHTFYRAILEIRYRHEVRLQREESYHELFNISHTRLVDDVEWLHLAVDVEATYVKKSSYYGFNKEIEENNEYYHRDFSAASSEFSRNVEPLHRRREIEMQQYRILTRDIENPETIRKRNIWSQYQTIYRQEMRRKK